MLFLKEHLARLTELPLHPFGCKGGVSGSYLSPFTLLPKPRAENSAKILEGSRLIET